MTASSQQPRQLTEDEQLTADFYDRSLGRLPGRLMAALSLLADLRYSSDWTAVSEQTRQAVESAEAFVADVFRDLVQAEAETPDQLTMNNTQRALR